MIGSDIANADVQAQANHWFKLQIESQILFLENRRINS